MKKTYSTPAVQDLGSVTALTQGSDVGNDLDAAFPVGTPRGDLTFS